jgi:hypothetical protein
MEKTIAALRRGNVTITDEPFTLGPGGLVIAFVEDPDGTLIELIEKSNERKPRRETFLENFKLRSKRK